jgi:hypothetical protein
MTTEIDNYFLMYSSVLNTLRKLAKIVLNGLNHKIISKFLGCPPLESPLWHP